MQIIPNTAPINCTPGERLIFNVLKNNLIHDDHFVWFEPTVFGRRQTARPDFLLLSKNLGVVVIEVKDINLGRVKIQANRDEFKILQGEHEDVRSNPEKQVLQHLYATRDQINEYKRTHPEKYNLLVQKQGPHKGKLSVPFSHMVAFPNVNRTQWEKSGFAQIINEKNVLLSDDLGENIEKKISEALIFPANLNQKQVETLKWMLYPEIRIRPEQMALLDTKQASLIFTDTYLPPEQEKLISDFKVNLVRGVAGSGKTLLLLKRAKFLIEEFPKWKILVLTYGTSFKSYLQKTYVDIGGDPKSITISGFHKWCKDLLETKQLYIKPQDGTSKAGLLKKLLSDNNETDFSIDFLIKEFDWIKERIPYRNWDKYPDPSKTPRTGRKHSLGNNEREKRKKIYEIFNLYQETLEKSNMCDWEDVPVHLMRQIDKGNIESQCYDAILIDEAQDFAPIWFSLILRMIKPKTGTLFIVGDGAQKIYRNDITWKEIGIIANKNNTTILRRSYRSTREILNAALEIIQSSQSLVTDLSENGDGFVEPEESLKHGPLPILMSFENQASEADEVAKEILKLLQQGYLPQQIAILHRHRARRDSFANSLKRHGVPTKVIAGEIDFLEPAVKLCTIHSVKGLEFEIIFICGLDDFSESKIDLLGDDDLPSALERERKLLYVGMTRARHQLYITYSNIEPKWIIQNMKEKFEKNSHSLLS